jgi:hypothetical protein
MASGGDLVAGFEEADAFGAVRSVAVPRTNRIGRTTPPNPNDDDTESTLRRLSAIA